VRVVAAAAAAAAAGVTAGCCTHNCAKCVCRACILADGSASGVEPFILLVDEREEGSEWGSVEEQLDDRTARYSLLAFTDHEGGIPECITTVHSLLEALA